MVLFNFSLNKGAGMKKKFGIIINTLFFCLILQPSSWAATYYPQKKACNMEISCPQQPGWNIILANITQAECSFIVSTYGNDTARFCKDLFNGDVATGDDEEEKKSDGEKIASK
jgi:hypothetical protein